MMRLIKYKLIKVFSICLLITLFSCNQDEIETPSASTQAKFTVAIENNGIAPARVHFVNQSVNALNSTWYFGTGDTLYTDDLDTITYTYQDAGTFKVKLKVESENSSLYYNILQYEKTLVIRDLPVKRIYFTDRVEGKVKYFTIDDENPLIIEEFESATLNKPYGMHMDTTNGKLYVTDYSEQVMNRYNWDGTTQEILMNTASENFGSPIGIIIVENKIYWGEPGGIHTAELDGSNPEIYISIEGEYPQDIAYDHINHVFFFTNDLDPESGGIWKVDFDGTNMQEIIPDVWGGAIEVDPESNRLYYYVGYEGMYISELDGSNPILFDSSNAGKWAWGMAIDKENGKIYYPNRVEMTIMRANLDGSNVETYIPASAEINPNAMTIDTYR